MNQKNNKLKTNQNKSNNNIMKLEEQVKIKIQIL